MGVSPCVLAGAYRAEAESLEAVLIELVHTLLGDGAKQYLSRPG